MLDRPVIGMWLFRFLIVCTAVFLVMLYAMLSFDKLSNETHFVGLSFEKAAARRSALAALARLRAEFAIDRQENMRFCRAEMPSYCVKDLENTQSILCGLFLVCEHFCSGRTASHRTALDFRGIFVLLDAGGLSPAKDKRAKSTEKTGCPTHGFPARRWLIFSDVHAAGENG